MQPFGVKCSPTKEALDNSLTPHDVADYQPIQADVTLMQSDALSPLSLQSLEAVYDAKLALRFKDTADTSYLDARGRARRLT